MPLSTTYETIICENDASKVLDKIREYLDENKTIKDICLLDQNNTQIVFVIDQNPINHELAAIWWDGYSTGLKTALG